MTFMVGGFLREGADVGGLNREEGGGGRGLLFKLKHLTVRTMTPCRCLSDFQTTQTESRWSLEVVLDTLCKFRCLFSDSEVN